MCGFAEQLEFLGTLTDDELATCGGRDAIEDCFGRPPKQPAIFTSTTRRPMAFRTGTPARPDWTIWRMAGTCRRIRSML